MIPAMTPEKALSIVANAAKDAPRTLAEHQQIQAAVQTLIDLINQNEEKSASKQGGNKPKSNPKK